MKRLVLVSLALVLVLGLTVCAFAADKAAIQKQVDDIVVAIDSGKAATDFASAAQNKPYYVFILEEGGNTLVHPSLAGKSLKEAAEPVYNELIKATPEGVWIMYTWKDKEKNTYVRKTKSGLIVGSGY